VIGEKSGAGQVQSPTVIVPPPPGGGALPGGGSPEEPGSPGAGTGAVSGLYSTVISVEVPGPLSVGGRPRQGARRGHVPGHPQQPGPTAVPGKTADDVLGTDAQAIFAELGLKEHLTPQRSNGFAAMVERIRSDARAVAAPRPEPVRLAVSRSLELQRS